MIKNGAAGNAAAPKNAVQEIPKSHFLAGLDVLCAAVGGKTGLKSIGGGNDIRGVKPACFDGFDSYESRHDLGEARRVGTLIRVFFVHDGAAVPVDAYGALRC